MPHFAEIQDGIVVRVIVADQAFIDSGLVGDPASWVETSYNTRGNKHPGGKAKALRKNYAGVGGRYDKVRDAFYSPSPHPSWVLDEDSCIWEAPIKMPKKGGPWTWDEATLAWVKLVEIAA
jgi:hypothetical protein